MKKTNQLLVVLVLLIGFLLVGCDKNNTTTTTTTSGSTTTTTETTTQSIETLLQNASNQVIISNSDNMTMDFQLPAEVGQTTVTWSSDKPEYLIIADTVSANNEGYLFYAVQVEQPSELVGDVTVILTGTFSIGEATYTKTFPIRVRAEVGLTSYTTFAELHDSAALNDLVTASGIVAYKYRYGYFLEDANGDFLNVYTTLANVSLVNVGDEVMVKGSYSFYHSLYQVKDLTEQTVKSTGHLPIGEPIVLTDPSDLFDVDYSIREAHGQSYTVTVTPTLLTQGTNTNVYLFDNGVRVATVYYGSSTESLDALKLYVGQKVTITVNYYTYYESGSSSLEAGVPEVWVTFSGLESDIIVGEQTDLEKLTIDKNKFPSSYNVSTSLELPTLTNATIDSVTISSELVSNLSYDGSVFAITRGTQDVTGTITVALSYNSLTDSVVIPVTVKAEPVAIGQDLFISEYVEGGSYEKYIEIYNPLGESVSLSEYILEVYFNGNITPTTTALSGTLAPGDVCVISHGSAVLFVADITNSSVINFNGNDIIVLKHNGVVIDSIGQIGNGTIYSADVTLVRKPSVSSGDIDPTDVYDVTQEWVPFGKDDVSHLGSHTVE